MNFISFPVATTNIFPAANSTSGSQLLSEWNIRCRETVSTPSSVQYQIGHSFVHSMSDFEISVLQDGSGNIVNTYTLQIAPGVGIVNGHFIESLVPITIDLLDANATLQEQSRPPLRGKLAVGLRAFYATEQTVLGTLLVENDEEMFVGIQPVILPYEEFITPVNSPDDPTKVTADILLATFNFNNNKITSIINSPDKTKYISSDRLMSIDQIVSEEYIRKTGLNSKKLYAFAGKGIDPATGLDTWEDVTGSIVVWDSNPQRTLEKPSLSQSQFIAAGSSVFLAAVPRQVVGMTAEDGSTPEYYAPRLIEIPQASYNTNTAGIVNKEYTEQIKMIAERVNDFHNMLTGKQVMFIDSKDGSTVLPSINTNWENGDYILVGQDYTADDNTDGVRPPSTMYVVLPGLVESIDFDRYVDNSDKVPSDIDGTELAFLSWSEAGGQSEPDTSDPENYPEFYSDDDNLRGVPGHDYFRLKYTYQDNTFRNYYFLVDTAGKRVWSNYVMLTGSVPLATETAIGGFLNVSEDALDKGYVYRDEYGRLRLLDYALLRQGTLAYQLASDLTLPSGVTTQEVQTYLDEYVNQRIAFPDAAQIASGSPNFINVYINLTEEAEAVTLNINDIDSRFNTAVYLHIQGTATSTTTINIYDCEKIRIDAAIGGTPVINVMRSGLYYDPLVFNYIRQCTRDEATYGADFTGFQDLKIWYALYEDDDPQLVVDGMTVSQLDSSIAPTSTDYWAPVGAEVNDNNYLTALKSITFAPNGDIVQCGLLVANQSTDNVAQGDKMVVGSFLLPQGSSLIYPNGCLTKPLKVTGTFVTAYRSENEWYVSDTSFSAVTNTYDPYNTSLATGGNIAFHTRTVLIPSTISQTSIPAWESDTFHLFFGGVIG